MKKSINLIIVMGLVLCACDHQPAPGETSNKKKTIDCLPDSVSALVRGKKLLIDKYEIDSSNHTFSAILSEDSIWHVVAQPNVFEGEQMNDTIPYNRGGESVSINKHDCDIIGFFIAR